MAQDNSKAVDHFRRIVGDAFAFVRSAEANKALSGVTLDSILSEVIARSGDEAVDSGVVGNYLTGTDASSPTKISRIQKIKNDISETVESMKEYDPSDLEVAEEG